MLLALIEFLLLVFKAGILSAVYALFLFLLLWLVSKLTDNRWLAKRMQRKFRFWLFLHCIIGIALLLYAFSYWQDTGLGDHSRIPIGYGQDIQSEDFEWSYFYPDPGKTAINKDELMIEDYGVSGRFLCATVSHKNTISPNYDFVVYDLKERMYQAFKDEAAYTVYATEHKLPLKQELYGFKKHYREYLDQRGWKKWLLP